MQSPLKHIFLSRDLDLSGQRSSLRILAGHMNSISWSWHFVIDIMPPSSPVIHGLKIFAIGIPKEGPCQLILRWVWPDIKLYSAAFRFYPLLTDMPKDKACFPITQLVADCVSSDKQTFLGIPIALSTYPIWWKVIFGQFKMGSGPFTMVSCGRPSFPVDHDHSLHPGSTLEPVWSGHKSIEQSQIGSRLSPMWYPG